MNNERVKSKIKLTRQLAVIFLAAGVSTSLCFADPLENNALPVVNDPGTASVVTDPTTSTMTWTAMDPVTIMQLTSGNLGSAATLNVYLPTDTSRLLAKVTGNGASFWEGTINCLRGLFVFENINGLNIG